ncbi:phospho-N-acetylmuramoyl-pentapeptide-transferase [candidate division KSB1 bacterium]
MIYLFYKYIETNLGPETLFRLLKYISFRASFAFLTAFLISIIFGRKLIVALHKKGFRETSREKVDPVIQDKSGTPTMGGLLIIISVLVSAVIWCNVSNLFVILMLCSIIWFGAIGYVDDLKKMKGKSSNKGLSRSKKLVFQGLFGLILGLIIFSESTSPYQKEIMHNLYIPFFKEHIFSEFWIYLPFSIFVLLSISNAVNFADGLDGLAIVPASTTIGVYGIFAYILDNTTYSRYLFFEYIPGTGEITIFAAAVIGAGLGFLWFNAYPAQVFMGDTGSQALGGLIGTVAILLKQEFLFLIAGGIFLAEAVSVLVQDRIGIAKIGRRIFFRAPLHHTFQFRGLPESTVVVRFWIVSIILALMSFVTLKLR